MDAALDMVTDHRHRRLGSERTTSYVKRARLGRAFFLSINVGLPGLPNRVSFCIEEDRVQANGVWRGEQQVEVFERLSEEEAVHGVGFLFSHNTLKTCITFICLAVLYEV